MFQTEQERSVSVGGRKPAFPCGLTGRHLLEFLDLLARPVQPFVVLFIRGVLCRLLGHLGLQLIYPVLLVVQGRLGHPDQPGRTLGRLGNPLPDLLEAVQCRLMNRAAFRGALSGGGI